MLYRILFIALLAMPTGASAEDDATDKVAASSGLEAWESAFEVFSHPRCANCHVPDDNRPRWSGPSYGEGWRYHGMNVSGGESRIGVETIPCMTCHTDANSDLPHGPPGAPLWALAPVEMVWWQKGSGFVCEQIKDEARNGGRSIDEIIEHVAHDELVAWGWNPGPGRERAPYSAQETANFLRTWSAAGAPCPPDSE